MQHKCVNAEEGNNFQHTRGVWKEFKAMGESIAGLCDLLHESELEMYVYYVNLLGHGRARVRGLCHDKQQKNIALAGVAHWIEPWPPD